MNPYETKRHHDDKRARRDFTDEFKNQVVQLYLNGKSKSSIIKEYDLSPFSLNRWVNKHQFFGSFKEKDNRSKAENELLELKKENKSSRWKMIF
ncbi:transposase [Clostridia bacterium]|nr:transposase [Clostridia bacterium]